jgi:uncharacterized protein YidB (DUF937 family)
MGMLDNVMNVVGMLSGGKANLGLLEAVGGLLKGNGLEGLLDSFKENGLEDVVTSWIGKGTNLPVSADQIKEALGSDKINELAEKAGMSPDDLPDALKDILPDFIDKLTPDGKIE